MREIMWTTKGRAQYCTGKPTISGSCESVLRTCFHICCTYSSGDHLNGVLAPKIEQREKEIALICKELIGFSFHCDIVTLIMILFDDEISYAHYFLAEVGDSPGCFCHSIVDWKPKRLYIKKKGCSWQACMSFWTLWKELDISVLHRWYSKPRSAALTFC